MGTKKVREGGDGRSTKGVDQARSQMNEDSPAVKVDTTKELRYLFRPSGHRGQQRRISRKSARTK